MSSETLIYIILAGIIALLLALFQYFTKKKSMSMLSMLFSFLRFLTIFSILLLLINPKFDQITVFTEKPNLVVAIDNSNSVAYLKQDQKAKELIKSLSSNKSLKEKFNIEFYTFANNIKNTDSVTFTEKQTNIDKALNQLSQVYKSSISPTLLITDGNQTYGNDYEFSFSKYKHNIYPVILGDTISYTDLKIQQLNTNKYAYLKNRFPIEVILAYNGNNTVHSKFVVTKGNTTVYSESVKFSKNNNSKVVTFTLPTTNVGVSSYKASLVPLEKEKNKVNNSKDFAVEVIDQKTKIAIVSDFPHPDLGVLKKSIESNEQRSVVYFNSININDKISDFELIILYQPNNKFKKIYELVNKENKNHFVIIGTNTDLNFLNTVNPNYQHELTRQFENYQADLNLNYAPFIIADIGFDTFPALKSNYGAVSFSVPFQTILNKTAHGIPIKDPLLATFEINSRRESVLFGENLWQWRAQSFINTKSFNQFDDFIGKLVQYLSTNKQKNRLNLEYESFYNGSTDIVIKAQFFDKNFQFDSRESLDITVKNNISGKESVFPLVLKNNNYQVDLSNLSPSDYSFTVKASNENISKSGSFKILEYNVEQQFLNADVTKLQQLATNSLGKSYFIDNTESLINDLLSDNRYQPIQKSNKKSLPLVDWKYLLIILALSLSIEWFLRKYNGLI